MMRWIVLAFAISFSVVAAAQTVEEPDGYREENYRAPVPDRITGGTTIGTDEAFELINEGAAFVDVFPRAPKPANLPEGTIWRDKPHTSIEGAIWLPNVGYGQLADETTEYFRASLSRATEGDPSAKVVFFCRAECWMSWNAARRAILWGYSSVYWYPDGVDGWAEYSYPVSRVTPEQIQ